MDDRHMYDDRTMALDGNAAAGLMIDVFGTEMTASPAECSSCGYTGEIGTLLAYMRIPGVVLTCPSCGAVLVRIAATPTAFYVDARGAASIRLARLE